MKVFKNILFVVLTCFAAQSFAASKIVDFIDVKVPAKLDGSGQTVDEVKAAIVFACRDRGWIADVKSGNSLIATLNERNHMIAVEISFSESKYSIVYNASQNMDYDEKKHTIHKKYNKWVAYLNKSIQTELMIKKH